MIFHLIISFQTYSRGQTIVNLTSLRPYKPIMCRDHPQGIWLSCKSFILTSNMADLFLCIYSAGLCIGDSGVLFGSCHGLHWPTQTSKGERGSSLGFGLNCTVRALTAAIRPNCMQISESATSRSLPRLPCHDERSQNTKCEIHISWL